MSKICVKEATSKEGILVSGIKMLGWQGKGGLVWSVALPYVPSLSHPEQLSQCTAHSGPIPVPSPVHLSVHLQWPPLQCSGQSTFALPPPPRRLLSLVTWPWLHSHSAWLNPGHVKDWPRKRTFDFGHLSNEMSQTSMKQENGAKLQNCPNNHELSN